MARHILEGDEVHVAIMAQGVFSRGAESDAASAQLEELRACAEVANSSLGVSSLRLLDFPDNLMDTVDLLSVAKVIENLVSQLQPTVVYTHDPGDLNVDHVRTSEAVSIACRPVPGQTVRELFFFEVQSSTGWRPGYTFAPNYFVDATQTLGRKLDALRCYKSEMRDWPHARSLQAVEHLARWRGSLVGLPAAEAFSVARCIRG